MRAVVDWSNFRVTFRVVAVLALPPSDGARGPSSGEAKAGTCVREGSCQRRHRERSGQAWERRQVFYQNQNQVLWAK